MAEAPHEDTDPSLAADASAAEQRTAVEAELGPALDTVLAKYADHVTTDETDTQHLTLYLPSRGRTYRPKVLTVTDTTDASGNRTSYFSYGIEGLERTGWENHWKYTSGPDGTEPKFEPQHIDSTGAYVPAVPGKHFDATTDENIAHYGRMWIENFEKATPKQPKGRFIRAAIGKISLLQR